MATYRRCSHSHTEAYWDGDILICGKADLVPHEHDALSYGRNDSAFPVCGTAEIKEHIHNEECYPAEAVTTKPDHSEESTPEAEAEDIPQTTAVPDDKSDPICGQTEMAVHAQDVTSINYKTHVKIRRT